MTTDKDLTWDELANDYDSCHSGSRARTLPMKDIFEWAMKQEERYEVMKTGTVRYKVDRSKALDEICVN